MATPPTAPHAQDLSWPQPGGALRPQERSQVGAFITQARTKHMSIGGPSTGYRWDLTQVDKVTLFHPRDMVLSVETGLSLGKIKSLAESEKLWLPLDVPPPTAQADALSLADFLSADHSLSWLSHRYGTVRDWIVSLTAVDDRGREVTTGAKVVKNVAGYQLAPLYVGARDSLGPIVEVSFRLLPLPGQVTVARWQADASQPLINIWQRSREHSHPLGRGEPFEGLRLTRVKGQWQLHGFTRSPPEAVSGWAQAVSGIREGEITPSDILPREADCDGAGATVRLQVLPSRIAELITALQAHEFDLTCYPSSGVVHLKLEPDDGESFDNGHDGFDTILATIRSLGGRLQPLPGWSGQLPETAGHRSGGHIMARVKSILDPDRIFGPLPEVPW